MISRDFLLPQQTAQISQLSTLSLIELIEHIEATHHIYVRDNAPILQEYIAQLVTSYGEQQPQLTALANWINALIGELMPHLMKEERVLFPAIRALSTGEEFNACFGHIQNPINAMDHEHRNTEQALENIYQLTNDFQPPEGASQIWHDCYNKLAEFTADLRMHIYVEDQLLFTKALSL
ncbi:hemerythrin domain-containing protein [Shewanella gaetbuli]|uniref:Hemerythrin domain-containing protein n=1 Tax=Shewanella gaetbuli TaxID=220752 RepID=A0A9X1ZS09_9GAMM|nr:hemerythrin domain-containing protein [Shewanella gaetbuli]MCL1141096.1 hemerythrin domain-containing protein [Shewanella gaetbuli]